MRSTLAALALVVAGCGNGSTDTHATCVPESVPLDGFPGGDLFLETSSVQCPSSICVIDQRDADSALQISGSREACEQANERRIRRAEEDGEDVGELDDCEPLPSIADRVHCSCRCSLPGGETDETTCACGEGFVCVDDAFTSGSDEIQGGYCLRIRE
ncbi:MAG: hypothetical protein AAGE52_09570 [Myxococcota bacterium]